MSDHSSESFLEQRVLIFTPVGRTAEVLRHVFRRNGIIHAVCEDMQELLFQAQRGAGAVLLVEEVLALQPHVELLERLIREQPSWSDLQIVVFIDSQRFNPERDHMLSRLGTHGSIILQGRPVKQGILVSLIRGTLRQRARQYQLRDSLADLAAMNRSLEAQVAQRTAHLEDSEERLRSILTRAPIPVIVVTADGEVLIVSDMLLQTTGYGRAELSTLDDIFARLLRYDAVKRERAHAVVQYFFRNGRSLQHQEAVITMKSGEKRTWLLSTTVPKAYREGKSYIVSMAVDITERKVAEKQIRMSRDEAERANRAKSNFLASMSHEIRTPISGILGMIELLQRKSHGAEEDTYLAMMYDSARSLLSIIGEILDLSRIEAGKEEVSFRVFDLRGELARISAPFALSAREKGLDLSVEVSPQVPGMLEGDWEKIAQVLRNLISNAVKYTRQGYIRISATVTELLDGRCSLSFRVSDTGIGIPAGRIGELFEGYSRIHHAVTRKSSESTGLGLWISRRLVELLGGRIAVESEENQGSTFHVTVPVRNVEAPEGEDVQLPDEREGLEQLSPLRILLAEDNRINGMFIQAMLAEAGHQVHVVGNGKTAVQVVREHSSMEGTAYDLVLMDVQMPEMDGIEATRELRRLSGPAADLPVIALTAFAMKDDRQRILNSGMDGYVSKPIEKDALAKEIRRVLKKR